MTRAAVRFLAAMLALFGMARLALAETETPDACRSKTDGCQVCAMADGKTVACSLPGIACTKGEWHCNAEEVVPPLPEAKTDAAAPSAPPATAPAETPAPGSLSGPLPGPVPEPLAGPTP